MIENTCAFKPFNEHVLALGAERNLVAITTDADSHGSSRPTVLMLNAGVLHRVGPRRLHVLLGRDLSAKGFKTCRVDLSGIGDSGPISGNISFRESAVADTRAVMDELAKGAAERFVLFGLCAGADNSLAAAARDPRVAAVVLLDAHSYPTKRAYVRELLERKARSGVFSFVVATALTGGRLVARSMRRRKKGGMAAGRVPPPQEEFRKLLADLVERGTRVLFVYSATMQVRFNHKEQLFELFPEFRGRIEVEYFGDADHAFTELSSQKRLMDTVAGWLEQAFP